MLRAPVSLLAALLLAVPLLSPASGEETRRVLRIQPFAGEGLGTGEASALQSLVTSYVVELRSFRVIDAAGQELALREAETAIQLGAPKDVAPLAADYILSANAMPIAGLVIFTLELTKVASGEKRVVTESAASVNELILSARRLTRSLFDLPADSSPAADRPRPAPQPSASGNAPLPPRGGAPRASGNTEGKQAFASAPSAASVAGTWRGDKGIERVSLFPDGRGVAVLSSGSTMKLKVSASGASLVIVQDQPSIPEFYRSPGLDLKAARTVAQAARPWKWVFSLAADGESLVGVKESVFVTVDAKGVVSVDNNYVRDAVWSRLYR